MMAHWTQSATLTDPPELTDEETALQQFKAADLFFVEACQRLDRHRRENVTGYSTIVGQRLNIRIGKPSPTLVALEEAAAGALHQRNLALAHWAQLKMANEHGG